MAPRCRLITPTRLPRPVIIVVRAVVVHLVVESRGLHGRTKIPSTFSTITTAPGSCAAVESSLATQAACRSACRAARQRAASGIRFLNTGWWPRRVAMIVRPRGARQPDATMTTRRHPPTRTPPPSETLGRAARLSAAARSAWWSPPPADEARTGVVVCAMRSPLLDVCSAAAAIPPRTSTGRARALMAAVRQLGGGGDLQQLAYTIGGCCSSWEPARKHTFTHIRL